METIGTLLYEVDASGVATITLNRPDRMNSLGGTMKQDLATALFERARRDDKVRCVVITGQGDRAFCAGADIKERAGEDPHSADYFVTQKYTHELFRGIETFEKPTIAAINGVALGGGLEIALCCDLRYAADSARLGLPEARLGILPAAGGTQRLPRLIGKSAALELLYTSRLLDAQQSLALGLVNGVHSADSLLEEVRKLARGIAAQPPLSIRFIKSAVLTGMETDMDVGLDVERYAAAMLISTEDRKEGMRAFVEKRAPVFRGR